MVNLPGQLWGSISAPGAHRAFFFFYHSPPVPVFAPPPPPPLTKLSAPKNTAVMYSLLNLSPSIGYPREGRGCVANPPIFGPPRS